MASRFVIAEDKLAKVVKFTTEGEGQDILCIKTAQMRRWCGGMASYAEKRGFDGIKNVYKRAHRKLEYAFKDGETELSVNRWVALTHSVPGWVDLPEMWRDALANA